MIVAGVVVVARRNHIGMMVGRITAVAVMVVVGVMTRAHRRHVVRV